MPSNLPLTNLTILVPRTTPHPLTAAITTAGGTPIPCPVLRILPPQNPAPLLTTLTTLTQPNLSPHLLIFTSTHAVHQVATLLNRHRLTIPSSLLIATVGPQTAAACHRAGLSVTFTPPHHFGTEGLLQTLKPRDTAAKSIIIFRAQPTQDTLTTTLTARSASVTQIETYRRQLAPSLPPGLLTCWHAGQVHLVIVPSTAIIDALITLLGPEHRPLLLTTQICAYSPRIAAHCQHLNLTTSPLITSQPTDQSCLKTLTHWAKTTRPPSKRATLPL